jgi:hypothetical protein
VEARIGEPEGRESWASSLWCLLRAMMLSHLTLLFSRLAGWHGVCNSDELTPDLKFLISLTFAELSR